MACWLPAVSCPEEKKSEPAPRADPGLQAACYGVWPTYRSYQAIRLTYIVFGGMTEHFGAGWLLLDSSPQET